MAESGDRMQAVLEGYGKFLRERDLALAKHQPYLVRWVREFLVFAQQHGGYTFEQTLDLFLAEVGGRAGVKPWRIQQAADAVRIYRYQYRRPSEDGEGGSPPVGLKDDAAMLARLREVIRLRHYAKSTEKTYLHWTRRFLEYRGGSGCTGGPTAEDAKAFLTRLAMVEKVGASTQNQAFSRKTARGWVRTLPDAPGGGIHHAPRGSPPPLPPSSPSPSSSSSSSSSSSVVSPWFLRAVICAIVR